jgi:hypothetical protein
MFEICDISGVYSTPAFIWLVAIELTDSFIIVRFKIIGDGWNLTFWVGPLRDLSDQWRNVLAQYSVGSWVYITDACNWINSRTMGVQTVLWLGSKEIILFLGNPKN